MVSGPRFWYSGREPLNNPWRRPFTVRRDLMDILACPICKSPLRLLVQEEQDSEVITGTLTCTKCGEVYPIEGAIPNLLPPDLRQQS